MGFKELIFKKKKKKKGKTWSCREGAHVQITSSTGDVSESTWTQQPPGGGENMGGASGIFKPYKGGVGATNQLIKTPVQKDEGGGVRQKDEFNARLEAAALVQQGGEPPSVPGGGVLVKIKNKKGKTVYEGFAIVNEFKRNCTPLWKSIIPNSLYYGVSKGKSAANEGWANRRKAGNSWEGNKPRLRGNWETDNQDIRRKWYRKQPDDFIYDLASASGQRALLGDYSQHGNNFLLENGEPPSLVSIDPGAVDKTWRKMFKSNPKLHDFDKTSILYNKFFMKAKDFIKDMNLMDERIEPMRLAWAAKIDEAKEARKAGEAADVLMLGITDEKKLLELYKYMGGNSKNLSPKGLEEKKAAFKEQYVEKHMIKVAQAKGKFNTVLNGLKPSYATYKTETECTYGRTHADASKQLLMAVNKAIGDDRKYLLMRHAKEVASVPKQEKEKKQEKRHTS